MANRLYVRFKTAIDYLQRNHQRFRKHLGGILAATGARYENDGSSEFVSRQKAIGLLLAMTYTSSHTTLLATNLSTPFTRLLNTHESTLFA